MHNRQKPGNKDKADIFSKQFESVYTRENADDIPLKGPSPYPDIEDISIDSNGIKKLLDRLNPNKASGPDDLSARVLKEGSAEIAQVLACIFNQPFIQAIVPDDWCQANVAPISLGLPAGLPYLRFRPEIPAFSLLYRLSGFHVKISGKIIKFPEFFFSDNILKVTDKIN